MTLWVEQFVPTPVEASKLQHRFVITTIACIAVSWNRITVSWHRIAVLWNTSLYCGAASLAWSGIVKVEWLRYRGMAL